MSLAEKFRRIWSTRCARRELRLSVLRGIKAAIKHRKLKDPRAGRDGIHSDPANAGEAAQGIHRAVHQGQPPELAEKNQGIAIIESYLPAGASERR